MFSVCSDLASLCVLPKHVVPVCSASALFWPSLLKKLSYKSVCIRPSKSQFRSKINWKHQCTLINYNILMKTNRFTCFMTKSLIIFLWRTIMDFCGFLSFFFISWDLFFGLKLSETLYEICFYKVLQWTIMLFDNISYFLWKNLQAWPNVFFMNVSKI